MSLIFSFYLEETSVVTPELIIVENEKENYTSLDETSNEHCCNISIEIANDTHEISINNYIIVCYCY